MLRKKSYSFRSGRFHMPDLLWCRSRCTGTAEGTQKVQTEDKEADEKD